MIDATLLANDGTDSTPRNGGLNGVPPEARPAFHAKKYKYYWRWYDEPAMEPQFLCSGVVNQPVNVPFDMNDRDIVIMQVAFDQYGRPNVSHPRDGASYIFTQNTVASLVSVTFSGSTMTLTIANNGGTGDIHILRELGAGDFVEVASVSASTTSTTDTVTLNGTYTYTLSQDGLPGFSNPVSAVASGISGGGGTGTTPDTFSASGSDNGDGTYNVDMGWTNHGGTGSNVIQISYNFGSTYVDYDSVVSSATTYTIFGLEQQGVNKTYYFRVRNTSATGTSNEVSVFIPRL